MDDIYKSDYDYNEEGFLPVLGRLFRNTVGRSMSSLMVTLILVYFGINAIHYVTTSHVESYEVVSAPLTSNETYTGLVLKEEKVVRSELAGYISYYAREGDKINAGGAVYGLSASKDVNTSAALTRSDLIRVRSQLLSFSRNFHGSSFNSVYAFKSQLEGSILQYVGITGQSGNTSSALTYQDLLEAQTNASGQENGEYSGSSDSSSSGTYGAGSSVTYGSQTIVKATSDGIVLYAKDGYEGKALGDISRGDFNQRAYHVTNLKTDKSVMAGDEIYTLVTDENWSLIIPLSEKQAVDLSNRKTIRVRFLKDDMTQTGDFSIIRLDNARYGKIDFDQGLIRYAQNRFLEVELVTNTSVGLKIPLSSIVTKDFFVIPSTYQTENKETKEKSFQVQTVDENGRATLKTVYPTIYSSQANGKKMTEVGGVLVEEKETTYTYYVDDYSFKDGDILLPPVEGQSRYTVHEKAPLEGVYCINQGYARFRRIEILNQNEEYAIIDRFTSYGVSRFDHIVKNAKNINEQDVLY